MLESHYNKKRLKRKCFPVNIMTLLRVYFYRAPPAAAFVKKDSIRNQISAFSMICIFE